MVLKRQQFENSKNDMIKPKILKCKRIDTYNNKEKQNLEQYENKSNKYVCFPLFS